MPTITNVPNTVAEAVIKALSRIDSTLDSGEWLTRPTVKRGLGGNISTVQVPALLVSTTGDTEWKQETSGSVYREQLTVDIFGVVEGNESAEPALSNLLIDVKKALSQEDWSLGGVLYVPPVLWTARQENQLTREYGRAVLRVSFIAYVEWARGAP
jgi:hypothetical protein